MRDIDIDNDLIKEAQNGNKEALDTILKVYIDLVSINAKKYFIIGAEQEDLIQEGVLGLLKAIKSYDKEKSQFKTFAILCIRNQIITAIKAANRQKNSILNEAILNLTNSGEKEELDDYKYAKIEDYKNPEEIYLMKEKLNNFMTYINENLSKLEKEVFNYMIRGYSYREIAKILSKELKTIDNAMQRIRNKSEIWLKQYEIY